MQSTLPPGSAALQLGDSRVDECQSRHELWVVCRTASTDKATNGVTSQHSGTAYHTNQEVTNKVTPVEVQAVRERGAGGGVRGGPRGGGGGALQMLIRSTHHNPPASHEQSHTCGVIVNQLREGGGVQGGVANLEVIGQC